MKKLFSGEKFRKKTKIAKQEVIDFSKKTVSKAENLGVGFWVFVLLILGVGLMFLFVDANKIYDLIISKYGLLGLFLIAFITDLLILPLGVDIPLILAFMTPEINEFHAFGFAWYGTLLAIFVSYLIGWKWGIAGIKALVTHKQFEKFNKYKKYGSWYLFVCSLTPLPYIPYLAGVYRLSFKETCFYLVFPKTLRYIFYWLAVNWLNLNILSIL